MDHHEKLVRAQRKVEEMTGFYIHLAVFGVVMALMLVINTMDSADGWWCSGLSWAGVSAFLGTPGPSLGARPTSSPTGSCAKFAS
jgi:hypothetical protein